MVCADIEVLTDPGMGQGLLIYTGSNQAKVRSLIPRVYPGENVPFWDSHLAKFSTMLAPRCSVAAWSKEPAHKDQASAFLKTNLKKFLYMALQSKQKPCQIVKKALT